MLLALTKPLLVSVESATSWETLPKPTRLLPLLSSRVAPLLRRRP